MKRSDAVNILIEVFDKYMGEQDFFSPDDLACDILGSLEVAGMSPPEVLSASGEYVQEWEGENDSSKD